MRAIIIVASMALGIGLAGIAPSSAAPANGFAIQTAAHLNQVVDQANWRWHRRHWWWRHHHHHRWWW
jgi:hypothetical protein